MAPPLHQRRSCSLQEAIEIVAGPGPIDGGNICGIIEGFDECDKEVVDAIAQLLNVGVLIGGTFISINSNPLVYNVA